MLRINWLIATRLGVLLVILQWYTWFRKTFFVPPAAPAFAHARQIMDAERALGLDIELSLQQWTLRHDWLIHFSNAYYLNMKTVIFFADVPAVFLAPVAFRRYRHVFIAVTIIAVPWYAVYPLAPPRFMDRLGIPFVDTVARFSSNPPTETANPYAAMPSMHICWSVVAALFLAAAIPWRRIGAILGTLHVGLMAFVVMVTGNHYLFDVAEGLVVDAAALGVVRLLPAHFSWPESPKHILATLPRCSSATSRRVEPPE